MLSPRPNLSPTKRRRLFELHGGCCHICKNPIDLGHEAWEIDHVHTRAMLGCFADTDDNMRPAHYACHKDKTGEDAGHIAEAKGRENTRLGFRRSERPLPCGKTSAHKRLIGGRTVPRFREVRP